ncbi:MAG: DUF899 domain-containing protein, partial [Pseudomonadota bacterium]
AEKRRALPWVRVPDYPFTGPEGSTSLRGLFGDASQLIIQHYMYAPGWTEGCRSCSFWADQFDPAVVHLRARDVAFAAVSQAPWSDFAAFKERMGWSFNWVSSADSNFSNDFHVWYTPEQLAAGETAYNFEPGLHYGEHAPGVSVFVREGDELFHSYSCYARGLDALNGAYQLLDLVPAGRNERVPPPMSWLKLHDAY